MRCRRESLIVAFLLDKSFYKELVLKAKPAKFGGYHHASGQRMGLFLMRKEAWRS